MLGPIYNAIGNLLGEDRPTQQKEEEVTEDPEDFCPGFLFDVSASWVLLVRRLLIPEYARARTKESPDCSKICKCGLKNSGASGKTAKPKKRKGFTWRC